MNLFYQECEHCATENPDLIHVIEKIDYILHSLTPASVIRSDEIASQISEINSQVSGIIGYLCDEGLLYEKEYLECPQCETLNNIEEYNNALLDEDSFECSGCQSDLTRISPEKINVYRLNARNIQFSSVGIDNTPPNDSKFKTNLLISIPPDIQGDPFIHTPLLQYYSRDPQFVEAQPFKNKRMFVILHFLRDIIPFVEGMKKLGLDMQYAYFFYKDYPYPQKEAIIKWLLAQGATVQPRSYISQYLKQHNLMPQKDIGKIIIIEDGGFIVPEIHQKYTNLIPCVIGAVEQTTRGIWNDEKIKDLRFPVISVAKSELKGSFEPPYIGKAVVENIQRMLPDIAFNGKNIAIFGYGTIGKEIAIWFRSIKSIVTVFDPSASNRLSAHQNGFSLASSPGEAARNKNFVIGASGNNSINSSVIAHLAHGTYLISASSELYEIDIDELDRLYSQKALLKGSKEEIIGTDYTLAPNNRVIHVIANGYPINFWGFESMPNQASDLIMSLIFLCACELGSKTSFINGIDSDAVNKIALDHKLAEKFLEIHQQG